MTLRRLFDICGHFWLKVRSSYTVIVDNDPQ